MTTKNTYKTSRMEYMQILNKNLEIRHRLADIMPYLADKDLEKYQEFFKFTEKLEKKILLL